MLVQFHGVKSELFSGHLVSYHDEGVVGHLFRVAASLESLVLGEGQILGQVRDAYKAAVERKTVGPIFHTVFQTALRVGKLVRERTGMDQGKLSVASVAVDLAREVFDSFADKTVLVIGAGKMGELTLQHLKGLKPGQDPGDQPRSGPGRGGGGPLERPRRAVRAAGPGTDRGRPGHQHHRRHRADRHARAICPRAAARRNRLALILDIAIPRDFDPRIGDLDQVMLYHVDDLRAQAEQNRLQRQKGIDPALAIIERETAACYAQLRHQHDAGAAASATREPCRPDPPARAGRAFRRQAGLDRGRPRGNRAHGHASAKPVPPPPQGRGPLGRHRAAPRSSSSRARFRAPRLSAWAIRRKTRSRRSDKV